MSLSMYNELASWREMGDGAEAVQYRNFDVYQMQWEGHVNLSDFIVSCAPFGGPVALILDISKIVVLEKYGSKTPPLMICTSSGRTIARVPWEHHEKIIQIGWNAQENLVIVLEDGGVFIYSIHGERLAAFSLFGRGANNDSNPEICDACIWGTGLVALTTDFRLFLIDNFAVPKPLLLGVSSTSKNASLNQFSKSSSTSPKNKHALYEILGGKLPTSMSVVEPHFTGRGVEVLLATSDASIVVVCQSGSIEDQGLQGKLAAPAVDMKVAPNGRFVACFTARGILSVLSSSFKKKVLDFNTKSLKRPEQISWCGEDSVVLHWKELGMLMVGPFGDWLKYTDRKNTNSNVALPSKKIEKKSSFLENEEKDKFVVQLVQEVDCVRIISNCKCSILQRVPTALEKIRALGSTEASALLYDACRAFHDNDPKADDYIRTIVDNLSLPVAVENCARASSCEFRIENQKSLLRTSSYGKWFSHAKDVSSLTSTFIQESKKVRVLNALRDPDGVGMPLTSFQYDVLTAKVVIDRLVNRNEHLLALKVSDYLRMRTNHILEHWAAAKVKYSPNTPDAVLCRSVREKLSKSTMRFSSLLPQLDSFDTNICKGRNRKTQTQVSNISYARIAAVADSIGRRNLATMLLEYESKPSSQVPMLLSMQEDALALDKATISGDADLIYLALLHIKRAVLEDGRGIRDFFALVEKSWKRIEEMRVNQSKQVLQHNPNLNDINLNLSVGNLVGGLTRGQINLGLTLASDQSVRRAQPIPADLLATYCKIQDPPLLKQLLFHMKEYREAGLFAMRDAYTSHDFNGRLKGLKVASGMFYSGHKSGEKDLSYYWKATEEQMKLLVIQKDLEKITGENYFIGMSVCETIYNCIVLSQHSKAATIKSTFALPDKRFWRLKVCALAECRDWKMLQNFANEKRPPIGYRPFAEACLNQGNKSEAAKYIARIKDEKTKIDLYKDIGHWVEAAEICGKLRDEESLADLIKACEQSGETGSLNRVRQIAARSFQR
eukprot:g467.t1